MRVKVAKKEDFQRLEPVLIEVELHHVELEPEVFKPISSYDHEHFNMLIENDSEVIFYAEQDGEVAGVIIVVERERPSIPLYIGEIFAEVQELSVADQYRRQGVGTLLMEEAEAWAKSRGRKHMQLSVWAKNQGAVHFYEKSGYLPKIIRYQKDIC
jgi:ribosomal protein S18 acetylase RimI-like enzyme